MKKCLNCNFLYLSNNFTCPKCNYTPNNICKFPAFAPELNKSNNGFETDFHDQLYTIEDQHFWFNYRNILIGYFFNKYFPLARSFCEIGCGSGYVLAGLHARRPDIEYTASEIYSNALTLAASRVPDARFFQADICNFPFESEFDVIGVFDVLEHIEDDSKALKNIFKALVPGGGVILTVPQHEWLWSELDMVACHKRRYSQQSITRKLAETGFTIQRMTSFMSLLMPMMLFSRYIVNHLKKKHDPIDELQVSKKFTPLFLKICALEKKMIQQNLDFPFGGSLLCIATK